MPRDSSPSSRSMVFQSMQPTFDFSDAFQRSMMTRDQVCIKIPATLQSAFQSLEKMVSAPWHLAVLSRTSGRRISSRMLICRTLFQWYVQTYCMCVDLNYIVCVAELRVHFDPTLWKEYENMSEDHSMSSVIHEIVQVFKGSRSETLVMPASIITSPEASRLQFDHSSASDHRICICRLGCRAHFLSP